MITEVKVENCFIFEKETLFSLKADMRTKRLGSNVYSNGDNNIVKAAGIYGPNNSGKTCLLKCIRNIKEVIEGKGNRIETNLFSNNDISSIGVTFEHLDNEYEYNIKYNTSTREYVYESFYQNNLDIHKNITKKKLFLRDTINNEYYYCNNKIELVMPFITKRNILIHGVDDNIAEDLLETKEILLSLAASIEFIDMNNIPIQKTLNYMKKNNETTKIIVDFIKNADVDLDGLLYSTKNRDMVTEVIENIDMEDELYSLSNLIVDYYCLESVYKGKTVKSLFYDSTGTKKIIALASYIVEAIRDDKILVVDELDSSLHYNLTRAIVSMFLNELNNKAQLIFSLHDINLIDCKKLLRKDQIWLIQKDAGDISLYPLSRFTAESGLRETSDIIGKYKKGLLGVIPNPDLFMILTAIKGR